MTISFSQPLVLLLLILLPLLVWVGTRALTRTRRTWIITTLRVVAVASLILALAGTTLGLPRRDLSVVFLVDSSDSLGPGGKSAALEFVRRAYEAAGPADRTGLIVFGKEPWVEQDLHTGGRLGEILSRPDATATDIPSAIRLALALFPDDSQKRIVLVTDGNNNVGDLEAAARLAGTSGAQMLTHTLGVERANDVQVESLRAPERVRAGESFELEVSVSSTDAGKATLEALGDGAVIAQRLVELRSGLNRYVVTIPKQPKGFRRWQVRVLSDVDSVPQNNEGDSFTYVESPPRVLVAEAERGEGENLRGALTATGLDVTLASVSRLPTSLAALSEYSAVVLVDVPISDLPDRGKLLQTYVRDLGKGLVAVGGEQSYALGNYFSSPLEAALPVDSRLKNKQQDPVVAMVMAIDKSGSMAACHCGSSPGSFDDPPGSVPKVDTAKEATIQSSQLLGPDDEFGVVAFDTAARWIIRPAPIGDDADIADKVAGIHGSGGTNVYGGLAEAIESLKGSKASIKHVILLTDGWSNVGNYDKLISDARANGITISTVSAGGGSPELLRSIAEKGNGTFYVAKDNRQIPKILVRETQKKLQRYIREEEFVPSITAPSPVLKGVTSTPSLLGYVGTSPKPTASVALSSPSRDPVLAQWQYGLGRAVAWTSDARSRWSRNWIGTPEYARLWSQAVGWVLARPAENVQVQISQENGEATVDVDALRPSGAYINGASAKVGVVSPSGQVTEAGLTQTAPGRYSGSVPATEPGAYIASVSLTGPGQTAQAPTTGFAVGYSPEYKALGPNKVALERVASLTGGREIAASKQAYTHDLPSVLSSRPQWWPLTLLALLLLPVEVAVRRLKLKTVPLVTGTLQARRQATDEPRSRPATAASDTVLSSAEPDRDAVKPLGSAPTARAQEHAPTEEAPAPEGTDPMERLRSAKRRASKR